MHTKSLHASSLRASRSNKPNCKLTCPENTINGFKMDSKQILIIKCSCIFINVTLFHHLQISQKRSWYLSVLHSVFSHRLGEMGDIIGLLNCNRQMCGNQAYCPFWLGCVNFRNGWTDTNPFPGKSSLCMFNSSAKEQLHTVLLRFGQSTANLWVGCTFPLTSMISFTVLMWLQKVHQRCSQYSRVSLQQKFNGTV